MYDAMCKLKRNRTNCKKKMLESNLDPSKDKVKKQNCDPPLKIMKK